MLAFLRSTVAAGFMNDWQMDLVQVGADLPQLLQALTQAARTRTGTVDLSEI